MNGTSFSGLNKHLVANDAGGVTAKVTLPNGSTMDEADAATVNWALRCGYKVTYREVDRAPTTWDMAEAHEDWS